MTAPPCLVLMFKAPARSKRRIAGELGAAAEPLAEHLFACAAEDLEAWPGPVCYAPADDADAAWLGVARPGAGPVVPQGTGNLGHRIGRVNRELFGDGLTRQIFLGIDCPELTRAYLDAAADALGTHDVVLGPAADGGVVLMGVRGLWPGLGALPWSRAGLGTALERACAAAGLRVATLDMLDDVDNVADLDRLAATLVNDGRRGRRALRRLIESASGPGTGD